MKPIYEKILSLSSALVLIVFPSWFVYKAFVFGVVQGRGQSYRFAVNPVSFLFTLGLYLVIIVAAFVWLVTILLENRD